MRGKLITVVTLEHTGRIIPAHAGQTVASCGVSTAVSDHPRACGANWSNVTVEGDPDGSSPRMRGKRRGTWCGSSRVRIIPAHAGQTPFRVFAGGRAPDHPRACGANLLHLLCERGRGGSSPRMRGKRGVVWATYPCYRIIPAHAGQTGAHRIQTGRIPDHPRACGANHAHSCVHFDSSGSSPRMRGKLAIASLCGCSSRIIPAHAGQTCRPNWRAGRASDHPRACGANPTRCRSTVKSVGSSPRMRGKLRRRGRGHHLRRIIPAHAGQTSLLQERPTVGLDHPRACGANGASIGFHKRHGGSSPRMRGKPIVQQIALREGGIIPAHAGQTYFRIHTDDVGADHPRACGANKQWAAAPMTRNGSSPRMRGKRTWTCCIQ